MNEGFSPSTLELIGTEEALDMEGWFKRDITNDPEIVARGYEVLKKINEKLAEESRVFSPFPELVKWVAYNTKDILAAMERLKVAVEAIKFGEEYDVGEVAYDLTDVYRTQRWVSFMAKRAETRTIYSD